MYPETKARRQPSLPARSPSASTLRVTKVYHARQAKPARFNCHAYPSARSIHDPYTIHTRSIHDPYTIHRDAGARPPDRRIPPLWESTALHLQTRHSDEALDASGSYILR